MSADRIEPTWWRRASHTPIRDVLRGRMTGRLDREAMLSASGLPPACRGVIARVVRRTRLWPLEKADVCRELIAHFADGLAAGADEAALVRSFGEERSAAALIRRSKRRQRPLVHQAATWGARGAAGVFAAMVVGYGVLAWRYFTAEPVIRHDYVAAINAAARSVPANERAWPVYRGVLGALRPEAKSARDAMNDLLRTQPGWERWPELRSLVSERQAEIAVLHRASAMPGLGYIAGPVVDQADAEALGLTPPDAPHGKRDPVADAMQLVLLNYLGGMRNVSAWLAADARVAAEAGHGRRVVRDIVAIVRVAGQAMEIRLLINQLVSFAILDLASQETRRLIERAPGAFTDADLRDLAHALAGAPSDLAIDISVESTMTRDLIQRVYSDDGAGGGRLTPAWARIFAEVTEESSVRGLSAKDAVVGPIAMALAPNRREIEALATRVFDRIQAIAHEPTAPDRSMDGAIERMLKGSSAGMILGVIMPAMTQAVRGAHESAMRLDAAKVAVALEAHRRATGAYPASLDELIPRSLPAMPIDRYDGKPLRYALRDGRPVVYSVGSDRTDEGGVIPPQSQTGGVTRNTTDMILYPLPPLAPPRPKDDESP